MWHKDTGRRIGLQELDLGPQSLQGHWILHGSNANNQTSLIGKMRMNIFIARGPEKDKDEHNKGLTAWVRICRVATCYDRTNNISSRPSNDALYWDKWQNERHRGQMMGIGGLRITFQSKSLDSGLSSMPAFEKTLWISHGCSCSRHRSRLPLW